MTQRLEKKSLKSYVELSLSNTSTISTALLLRKGGRLLILIATIST